MKKIYCLSGLGADERIFAHLAVPGVELVHVKWVPHHRHDDLPAYAAKMSQLIPGESPTIIGLSFGGMLATEIAKIRPVEKVIIISSAKTRFELPVMGGILGWLMSLPIIPSFIYTIPNFYVDKLFGAYTHEEKELLHGIIRDANGHFVKWALRAVHTWRNETVPKHLVHIHGTADNILSSERSKPSYWIEGGTHIMIYNRAAEINAIIAAELAKK